MSIGLISSSSPTSHQSQLRKQIVIKVVFLLMTLTCPLFSTLASPTPSASTAPLQSAPTVPQSNVPNTAQVQPTSPATDNDRLPFMAEERKETEVPSGAGLLMRTLGALLLIVGMIAAGAWALKKYGGSRFGAVSEDAPTLRVMSNVTLGDKRSLAVVRFGERVLLVASTPQAVTLLAEHQTPNKVEETEIETEAPTFRSVADLLLERNSNVFAEELAQAEQRVAGTEGKLS